VDAALTESQAWATQQEKGRRGILFVDEITKPLLKKFFDYLVDGNEEEGGPENTPFTAAHKVMKVNSFYRAVFHLERGRRHHQEHGPPPRLHCQLHGFH
jgi:hypothetical protein